MEIPELMTMVARGKDSQHQFKKNITNPESLAAEMVAFSNGSGGKILVGVADDGTISGLTLEDIRRLNQLVSNVASQNVRPAIHPTTQNVWTDDGIVLVVHVPAGINRQYQDSAGSFWVKSAADKRKATSREEIQRLFQSSGLLHADESPANGLTFADLDMDYFRDFFQNRYGRSLDAQSLPLGQLIQNMNWGATVF